MPGYNNATVDTDGPGVERHEAGQHISQLDLAISFHTRDAHDLASSKLDIDAVENSMPVSVEHRSVNAQHDWRRARWPTLCCTGRGKDRSGEAKGCGLIASQRYLAPHHCLRQRLLIETIGWAVIDNSTAPQDGDHVGGLADLVELVAHEGHRLTFTFNSYTEHLKELLGLLRRQHRSRLIEDHD